MACDLCKDLNREQYAFVSLRVGQNSVTAGACKECFDAALNRQPALKAMIASFLPAQWREVIFGSSSRQETAGMSILRL